MGPMAPSQCPMLDLDEVITTGSGLHTDFGTLAKEMKFIAGIKYGLSSISDCTLIPGGLNFSLTVKNEEKNDIIQSCGCVQPSPGHHRHHLTSGVVMFRVLGPVGVKRSNGFV